MRTVTDVIERYLSCMTAHDWDGMAACLADDFTRVGPYGDTYEAKADYVAFIADLMPRLPGYSMDVSRVTYAGEVGVAELSETVELNGRPHRTPEALVFELDSTGLIIRVEVFIQTLGVEPRNVP
jgi:hypothetical protein